MENEQKFFKQQWWRRLLLSADNRIHYPEAVRLYHMVMGLGIVSALDFGNRGYSACYHSRMGGKKMIQTIIQLLANNPALFKDCEHRVCDARLAYRRKHGRAKKMRKAK